MVSIRSTFAWSLLTASAWLILSTLLAFFWADDLCAYTGGHCTAWIVIALLALIPGFISFFLLTSYALDVRPPRQHLKNYPGLSILIAAYNEEQSIQDTLQSVLNQHYEGPLEILVLDDGSSDQTAEKAKALASPLIKVFTLAHEGKAGALNFGLKQAAFDLIVTIDADTRLHEKALANITAEMESRGLSFKAIAGSLYAYNSQSSWIAALQTWDYLNFISAVKRSQSLFEGTLVAQGAFSLYRKEALQNVSGWPKTLGEDIVLTWTFLNKGWKTGWAEDAIAFTNVPETYTHFFRQRSRWARGLFEAFKKNPKILGKPTLSTFYIYLNLFFPLVDLAYVFILFPGLIAACCGCPCIVGLTSLILLPLSFAMNFFIYLRQKKVLKPFGYNPRPSGLFFLGYWLMYNLIMAPACVTGYFKEISSMRRKW